MIQLTSAAKQILRAAVRTFVLVPRRAVHVPHVVQVVRPAIEAAAVVLRVGLGAAEELDALDAPVAVAPRLAVDGLELDAAALGAVHTVDAPVGLAGLLGSAGDVAGAAAGSGDGDAAAPATV